MQRNVDVSGSLAAMDRFQQQAYELVTSTAARKAFDIASEDGKLRDRYGRHTFGQSAPRAAVGRSRFHVGHRPLRRILIAGGGIQGGRIVGSTDRLGEFPKDRPISPGDLHATIYKVLGVDPTSHFLDRSGRPVAAIDGGAVIEELF